jgi:hypothetical protein
MVRKFLYAVAAFVLLLIAGAVGLMMWSDSLTRIAFVPTARFTEQPALAANVYDDPQMWIARPGLGARDRARWLPPEHKPDAAPLPAAVFFIHPTSYLAKAQWNAPLDDAESRDLAATFVRGMASAFNASPDVWAPRYRQAAFGAFLTDDPQSAEAFDLAYRDVLLAFDAFLAGIAQNQPIVLAGHSQGSLHLKRLLRDRVAGTPLARRIAAAYVIGWPVSLAHDLPAMGLPACERPDQAGCVVSWLSFAEPADNHTLVEGYAVHQPADRRHGRLGRRRSQPRHAGPRCGEPDRHACSGNGASALRGRRIPIYRRAARSRPLCGAGQQLSRL